MESYLKRTLNLMAEVFAEEGAVFEKGEICQKEIRASNAFDDSIKDTQGIMKHKLQIIFRSFVKRNGYESFNDINEFERDILTLLFRTKLFSFQKKNRPLENHTTLEQKITIGNFKKYLRGQSILRKRSFEKVENSVVIISHCLQEDVVDFLKKELKEIGIEKIFVAGGGTEVFQIIEEERPDVVIGIACEEEVKQALEKIMLPALGIVINVQDKCSEKKNLI